MANVAAEYKNIDNVNFSYRAGAKSPTDISIISSALGNGSQANVRLGAIAKYTNVAYADGYLDFNRDPHAYNINNPGNLNANRQTRMHAINSWLHPSANTHPAGNQTRNLFWGSADTNGTHNTDAEEPNKAALSQIATNRQVNTLFSDLYQNNYLIKADNNNVVIDVTNQTLPSAQKSDFNYQGKNWLTQNQWKQFTTFALGYRTEVEYYNAGQLENYFLQTVPPAILARGLAAQTIDDRKNNFKQSISDIQTAGTNIIAANLANWADSLIKSLFYYDEIIEALLPNDLKAIFDAAVLHNDIIGIFNYLLMENDWDISDVDNSDKNVDNLFMYFSLDAIAEALMNDDIMNNEALEDALSTLAVDTLRLFLSRINPNVLIHYMAEMYVEGTSVEDSTNPGNEDFTETATSLSQLPQELLLRSDPAFRMIAQTAAVELEGMVLKQLKSTGVVYVPEPPLNWTNFKALNTQFETHFGDSQQHNLQQAGNWFPNGNEPPSKLAFSKNTFNI